MSGTRLDESGLTTLVTKIKSQIQYNPGDTISSVGYIECAGRTAASGKTLAFQIPLSKPIAAGCSLSLGTTTKFSIYHTSGNTSDNTVSTWAPTSTTLTYDDFGIRVTMPRSTTWFSSTNATVTVAVHDLTITVS